MRVRKRRPPAGLEKVRLMQPLSAFGAAAVLRRLWPKTGSGAVLMRLASAPYKQGHFTRTYTKGELLHWVYREKCRATLRPKGRWIAAADGMSAVDECWPVTPSWPK